MITYLLILFLLNVLLLNNIIHSRNISITNVYDIKLFDSTIHLTKEIFNNNNNNCFTMNNTNSNDCIIYSFINLHENENTSVVSARTFLYNHYGSLTKFNNGYNRLISFTNSKDQYSFDPNRMFTIEGINATLKQYTSSSSPINNDIINGIYEFSKNVLNIYDFNNNNIILALHNNGGAYGADDYLTGGVYASDAEKVNIVNDSNPSNFFYVVDPNYFNYLTINNYNVVLQNNYTVSNDGSLSYYCGLIGKSYINFEAQAEQSSIGLQVVTQLDMITIIDDMLNSN